MIGILAILVVAVGAFIAFASDERKNMMTDTEILAKVQHAMKPGETLEAFLKRAGFTNRHEVQFLSAAEIARYAALADCWPSREINGSVV